MIFLGLEVIWQEGLHLPDWSMQNVVVAVLSGVKSISPIPCCMVGGNVTIVVGVSI